jgi:hypothetical protein
MRSHDEEADADDGEHRSDDRRRQAEGPGHGQSPLQRIRDGAEVQ